MSMTMGQFRELTADVPDEFPVCIMLEYGTDNWVPHDADAQVDLTGRTVDLTPESTTRRIETVPLAPKTTSLHGR